MSGVPKIGVYICHCGVNISHTVDVAAVAEYAARLPHVAVSRDYTYMCSDPGQSMIKQDIDELGLTNVVVAACSPLMHEPTFRTACQEEGLNPYQFEQANIREQCSWVHGSGTVTTNKAMQLVASAVAKAVLLEPLIEREADVVPAALVVGGGVAGMSAALDIADAGFTVFLVEREAVLGGQARHLHLTFPTLESVEELLAPLVARVKEHPRIKVLTEAVVSSVEGYMGNFEATIASSVHGYSRSEPRSAIAYEEVAQAADSAVQRATEHQVSVGSIVVATGFEVLDPSILPEFGYGQYRQVITNMEFEQLAADGQITVGDGSGQTRVPQEIVFIHCVGSRDPHHALPYCSRVCCMVAARQAHQAQDMLPNANVTVLYMDVRAFGKGFEEFCDQVRREGVIYRRANPSEIIKEGDALLVRAEDTLLGMPVEIPADLVVLEVGMAPRHDVEEMAGILRLSRSPDGFFMEAHPKLRPVETATGGVFLAGCCQGPKDITDSIAQARAAAAAAMIPLMQGKVRIEPAVAFVDEELCAGCRVCEGLCSYGALNMHLSRPIMTVNSVLCQGCGACAMACPSGAMNLHHFTFDQVMAQVDTLVRAETWWPVPVAQPESSTTD